MPSNVLTPEILVVLVAIIISIAVLLVSLAINFLSGNRGRETVTIATLTTVASLRTLKKLELPEILTPIERADLSTRVQQLEEWIADSPEKILTIGRIVNRIERLSDENKSVRIEMDSLRKEMDRANTRNNWFIGILITLSLTFIVLAFTILKLMLDLQPSPP